MINTKKLSKQCKSFFIQILNLFASVYNVDLFISKDDNNEVKGPFDKLVSKESNDNNNTESNKFIKENPPEKTNDESK